MQGQGPNYFGAVADLARDVGGVSAQINERVTYKELMAQNTQQRHELGSRIDKFEEHISETVRASLSTLEARMESLSQRLETLATVVTTSNLNSGTKNADGSKKVVVGSVTTIIGAALGIGGFLLLRSFGVGLP